MTTASTAPHVERRTIGGIDIELVRCGTGTPLLLLHGFQNLAPDGPFLAALSQHAAVVAPSLPGFGGSGRPDGFDTPYDLAHHALDVLATLPDGPVNLVGLSFGGWIAAEVAIKAGRRIGRLVLVDAVGIKVSDRETPDILDVFNSHPRDVLRASWHDAERAGPKYDDMEDAALQNVSRNWAALGRYGWHPYLYNARLAAWLRRIQCPTLVLWGASDGIVKPSYGEAYARLIPGARFETIAAAGHHPEIEQPQALAARIAAFLG